MREIGVDERRRSGLSARAGWVLPLLLAAYFTGSSLLVPTRYSAVHLALLAAIYLALSVALTAAAALAARWGRALAALGVGGLALVLVVHWREQTRWPDSWLGVLVLAAALSPLLWWGALRRGTLGRDRALLWQLAVGSVGFALLFLAGFRASQVMRWHLLRHNTLLGTPAYYLLEPSVVERETALFDAHRPRDGEAPRVPHPLSSAPPPAVGLQPHLVFLLLDALRADALAAYGGDPTLMPELNGFLANSDRFQDMQVNATWTRPSVASFFTGLAAEEHGARSVQNFLGEEFVTLPELLQQQGYTTAAFVTNHAAAGRKTGFAQGFELFVEFPHKPYARAAEVRSAVERRLPLLISPPGAAGARPLFLYLHFLDPHEPYLSGSAPRGKRAAEYWAAYAAELRYLDRELGALLRYFESVLEGPVVTVVTADHGEEFFEHGQYSHGLSLYQEVLRIPFAVRSPASAGRDLPEPLEQRDAPLLLLAHAAGETVDHAEWARRSARPQRYSSIYFSGYRRGVLRPYLRQICMRSLREGPLKLIWSAYGDTHELYDLDRDPGELANLAAGRPDDVTRLRAAMESAVPVWSFGRTVAATGEELEQLRALGYIQ